MDSSVSNFLMRAPLKPISNIFLSYLFMRVYRVILYCNKSHTLYLSQRIPSFHPLTAIPQLRRFSEATRTAAGATAQSGRLRGSLVGHAFAFGRSASGYMVEGLVCKYFGWQVVLFANFNVHRLFVSFVVRYFLLTFVSQSLRHCHDIHVSTQDGPVTSGIQNVLNSGDLVSVLFIPFETVCLASIRCLHISYYNQLGSEFAHIVLTAILISFASLNLPPPLSL